MLKIIAKIGNSQGLIFNPALRELTGLKVGDQMNITVHDCGVIILTPIRKSDASEVLNDTIHNTVKNYAKTLQKLA